MRMKRPRTTRIERLGAGLATVAVSALLTQAASAQTTFANPPSLPQTAPSVGSATTPGLPKAASALSLATTAEPHAGKERAYDLHIQYSDSALYDPGQQRYQRVHLRSYVGTGVSPGTPFVAPEINVTPGDTVRITLHNDLPAEPNCGDVPTINTPHCFNTTNLHSHGLWVSPTGNSDNVLISIKPTVSFQYEYNIPADHPAGTFWYHPHQHGSTAIQVASGMAGALIIHGDRKPANKAGANGSVVKVNGDLDTLLIAANGQSFKDRTVLFQQIEYACTGADGKPTFDCKPDQVGVIEDYSLFGPNKWGLSNRWTSINGAVLPTFSDVQAGTVERWRLIHAGVRETINVEFHKMTPGANPSALPTKATLAQFLDTNCGGPAVPYQVVAADGLTMGSTLTKEDTVLQPGYRYDLLVVFPEAGNYCMTEKADPSASTVSQLPTPANLLGIVAVRGGTPTKDPIKTLVDTLVAAANRTMPADVKTEIVADLQAKDSNGKPAPRLTRFVPHPTITEAEVASTPLQEMVFYLGQGIEPNPQGFSFTVGKSFKTVKTDKGFWVPDGAAPYQPDRIDRSLILGTAQQWELRSYGVEHPFHIHVNPFQIVAILDPQGNDVSAPGYVEADGDSQYAGLRGTWKDTLWVKTKVKAPLSENPQGYYRLIVRTRYERYIGEYVLHCHILDHEDNGMMENVKIGISDGAGGLAEAHAHH
ncbi:MAG: multicopper oxidase domain-containing protein [Azospirillaceae bacterium]|nr:multicopper oxidase domain-containing protein [Azospirillaceae bacterium]